MTTGGLCLLPVLLSLWVFTNGQDTGPICFNCSSTENPEKCRQASTCATNQVCSVQEVIQPHGLITFWSGCEDISTCNQLSESSLTESIIGRRETSYQNNRCVYCCSTDLCNHNCTSFVNLALHRPAYQSSVASGQTADLAVDGDTTKNASKGSCMHTNIDQFPWWAVDLGNEYHVTKVKIYERNDAGADGRGFSLQIMVSSTNATLLDRNSAQLTQCGYYTGHSSEGDVITIDCPQNTIGRWVRIQDIDPRVEYFHMCEVEVFGF